MIINIAIKEFLGNLHSARFVIGFLLCLVLIPLALVVGVEDYKGKVITYNAEVTDAEKHLKQIKVYSQLRPQLVRSPEPLSIFSRGIIYNLGCRVKMRLDRRPFKTAGQGSVRDNQLMKSFSSLDFCTILALVLSLLALLFTYDACSGEREQGTLKLMFSNSVSRSTVLLGKSLGVSLSLLPILVFCYLLGILFIVITPEVSLSAGEWLRVGLLFATSLLYFGLFVLLGLFISSRFRSSAASIVVCLFAWVFFLFIVPNLAGYLAHSMAKVPPEQSMYTALSELSREYWDKRNEYEKSLPEPDWNSNWNYRMSDDGHIVLLGATRDRYENVRKLQAYAIPLMLEYADKKYPIFNDYLQQMDRQRLVAERLSLVSPSQVFRLLCSSLCRTDAAAHQVFMQSTHRYREQFVQYLRDKDVFSSYLYFTPVPEERFMTADEVVRYMSSGKLQTFEELKKYVADNGGFWDPTLVKREVPDWYPGDHHPYLDLNDLPRYQWRKTGMDLVLQSTLLDITALLCAGVILFFLSFVSFSRYDVR